MPVASALPQVTASAPLPPVMVSVSTTGLIHAGPAKARTAISL